MSTAVPVYFIHDNEAWLEPFKSALDAVNISHFEWDITEGGFDSIDFSQEPPMGVFYNRVSPSSHYRNKRYAMELTAGILRWLEMHNRIVINGTQSFQLEINKAAQVATLQKFGIRAPRTTAVMGTTRLVEEARRFNEFPFLLKHNRSGSGRGVRDFYSILELEQYLSSEYSKEAPPLDNIHLIQSFVQNSHFFRLEFCGGELTYAVRVRTGKFDNCPNEACQLDTSRAVGEPDEKPKFEIIRPCDFEHEYVEKVKSMFAENGYDIGSIEMIVDPRTGRTYVFDVNSNTNFNAGAEVEAQLSFSETGVGAFARLVEKYEETHFGYIPEHRLHSKMDGIVLPAVETLDIGEILGR